MIGDIRKLVFQSHIHQKRALNVFYYRTDGTPVTKTESEALFDMWDVVVRPPLQNVMSGDAEFGCVIISVVSGDFEPERVINYSGVLGLRGGPAQPDWIVALLNKRSGAGTTLRTTRTHLSGISEDDTDGNRLTAGILNPNFVNLQGALANLLDDTSGDGMAASLVTPRRAWARTDKLIDIDVATGLPTTVTRNDGGDFVADGFQVSPGNLFIRDSHPNVNGSYVITAVTASQLSIGGTIAAGNFLATLSQELSLNWDTIVNVSTNPFLKSLVQRRTNYTGVP